MRKKKNIKIKKILTDYILLFSTIIICILVFETILFLSNLNADLIKPVLYTQSVIPEIHKASRDPNRIYELKPNSSTTCVGCVHPLETKYNEINITVDRYGFRNKDRRRSESPGVFRIFIIGGSNTFGAAVSDQDTYPQLLEDLLNNHGNYEVWNAGISAYVLSQKVAYAEKIIDDFEPDLIIIQVSNKGRRGFQKPIGNLEYYFKKNKELYNENIPLLISDNQFLTRFHNFFTAHSNVYRFIFINLNNIIVKSIIKSPGPVEFIPVHEEINLENYHNILERYGSYGETINQRDFERFIIKHGSEKIVIFDPSLSNECESFNSKYKELNCFSLDFQNKSEEYADAHPPSYVYEWYAKELYDFLLNNGYLNKVNNSLSSYEAGSDPDISFEFII